MRELIDMVPLRWLVCLSMIFFMIITYLSTRISTRFFSTPVDADHRQLANTLITILSGGFSILLAFVIINTWNYLMLASSATSKEADYLASIIRNIRVFPLDARTEIMAATRNYTVTVRVNEWDTMRKGKQSQKAWDSLETLFAVIQAYQPKTDQEKIYYTQVVANVNGVLQSRRERLNELDSIIPHPLRGALVIGSIMLAIILGGIRGEREFLHITPALLFAAVLGFNLALALGFDYPFSGDVSVSNKLFYSGALRQFSD
ncbi:DUF4239 domain-containing protein [Legionella fairfieldensis]|uniref:bestrophin-like domain n=1 Tax=Legionella fairfieldensis TaxID=45064 RepID=UPI000684F20D|nr:DUF4239 domain-containing protein [Legionella fairfieldensis]